jgi:hypothetical protein
MSPANVAAILAGFIAIQTVAVDARSESEPRQTESADSLKSFLRAYFQLQAPDDHQRPVEGRARYSAAVVGWDGGPGRVVIVYVTGQGFCGTGGCPLLILSNRQDAYAKIARITATWPPIRVLDTRTHGWPDIGVWVEGGGIQPGYEAQLRFDGTKYPSNPTIAPARKLQANARGYVVISKTERGQLLF